MSLKKCLANLKTVSKRKYNFMSDVRIKELQEIRMKKATESKCGWAVTAYTDWRNERLCTFNYDFGIYNADINDLKSLTKENLNYSLCRFIPEVTKS